MSKTFKIKKSIKIKNIFNTTKTLTKGKFHLHSSVLEEQFKKSEFSATTSFDIYKFAKIIDNNSTNMKRRGVTKLKKIKFKISDKLLTIYSDEFSGKYNFYLPADIDIKSTDNVSISYNYDRGYLTGIRELYVNNILVIPEDKIKNISLTKILN